MNTLIFSPKVAPVENKTIDRCKKLLAELGIKNIVVWGHPLHNHTHSYIHEAFVHAGRYLEIPVYWHSQTFRKKYVVPYEGPVDHTLFISEHQVHQHFPSSKTSWYVTHNSANKNVPRHRQVVFGIYLRDTLKYGEPVFSHHERIINAGPDVWGMVMPWATNLLPWEFLPLIDYEKDDLENEIRIVGQEGGSYDIIHNFTKNMSIPLNQKYRMDTLEQMQFLRKAKFAPALPNKFQKDNNYIPCRVLKNISYGHLCITTSKECYDLLEKNMLFHEDEKTLAEMAEKLDFKTMRKEQEKAYEIVHEKHTYLNRYELILTVLKTKNDYNKKHNAS